MHLLCAVRLFDAGGEWGKYEYLRESMHKTPEIDVCLRWIRIDLVYELFNANVPHLRRFSGFRGTRGKLDFFFKFFKGKGEHA